MDWVKRILIILFEGIAKLGEGIMNTAQKVLTVLKSAGGGEEPTYDEHMVTTYSPLFYWLATEASGTDAPSVGSVASANGTYNAADIAGATTGPDSGEAPLFVAADADYLDVYSAALESAYTQNNVIQSCYFRYDGTWSTGDGTFFLTFSAGAANRSFLSILSGSRLRWRFISNSTTVSHVVEMDDLSLDDGAWHHALLALNSTGNTSALYIDGVSRATGVCPTYTGTTLAAAECGAGGSDTTPTNPANVSVSRIMIAAIPGDVATAAADIASLVTA